MLTTNGIAVTASITISDGHDALIRKKRSVTKERDRPPRAAGACLSAISLTEPRLWGETRERLRIAGLAHDRVLAGLHVGHDLLDWIRRRDQGGQAVRDRRDDRHALRDERQQRDVGMGQDVGEGLGERRRERRDDGRILKDRNPRWRQKRLRRGGGDLCLLRG